MPTMFAHFQHGRQEPEVVISHHLRHLSGPRKKLDPSHDNHADGMWTSNSLRMKLSVIVANRKLFDLTVEVAVTHRQSKAVYLHDLTGV